MDKHLRFLLLSLLIVVSHGGANYMNQIDTKFSIIEELMSLQVDDNEELSKVVPSWTSERGSKVLVNVDSFGAGGDGLSDDTQVLH